MRLSLFVTLAFLAAATSACDERQLGDPMQLDAGILTVDNRTEHDWVDVKLLLNQYYHAQTDVIRAKSRFTAPLRQFVSGWGLNFPYGNQQIWEIKLTAKQKDGTPVELMFNFERSRLEDALGKKVK